MARQTVPQSGPKLLVIVGPTGSGKSDLAVKLAQKNHGEIVSADSRQVYVGLDIGTAKLKTPRGIKQWLVDVARPDQPFTLQQYRRQAQSAIRDIHRRGKLPMMVGGTGLYVDAVVENWKIPPVRPYIHLRQQLEQDLAAESLAALVRRLRRVDPASVRCVDIRNPRRVIRALEVALTTGESFVMAKRRGRPLYDVLKIGLAVDRDSLQQRLRRRVHKMLRRGLIQETKRLLRKYPPNLPAMSGIGYAEAAAYIKGQISQEELVNRIVTRSRQYARRQMTWWKRDRAIVWEKNMPEIQRRVASWLRSSSESG